MSDPVRLFTWLGLSGLILMILKCTKVISMFQMENWGLKRLHHLPKVTEQQDWVWSQVCYTAVLNRREKARQGKVVRGSEVLGSSLLTTPQALWSTLHVCTVELVCLMDTEPVFRICSHILCPFLLTVDWVIQITISQPHQHWHLGLDNSWMWGAVL